MWRHTPVCVCRGCGRFGSWRRASPWNGKIRWGRANGRVAQRYSETVEGAACVRSVFWWRLLDHSYVNCCCHRSSASQSSTRTHTHTHARDLVHYLGVHNNISNIGPTSIATCLYISPSVPRAEPPSDFIKFNIGELCCVRACVCVTSGRGRRRKQLVDDLTETRG